MTGKKALFLFLGISWFLCMYRESFAGQNKWTTNGPFGGIFKSFAFDPKESQVMFASASNGVFRSKNSGKNWERLQISGEFLVVRVHPRNSETIVAASFSVFKSTNQGTDWEQISPNPFLGERISDMEFDPNDSETLYAVTFRAGVFKSENGGQTWIRKSSGLDLSGCCGDPQLEVDPKNGKIVYAFLRSKKVFKTTNGGQSWKSFSTGLNLQKDDLPSALAIDPNNSSVLFSGGGSSLFKTTNGGVQWSELNCACRVAQIAIDPNQSQKVFITGSQLSKSIDGGTFWQKQKVHPTLAASTIGIGLHPKIPNFLLIGGEGGGIFRSINGGSQFSSVAKGLTGFIVHHAESHSRTPDRIFAQGDQQVFLSSNGARSFKIIPPLSQNIVRDLAIHPKNPNLVVAVGQFSEDHMVAISTDGGKTWKFSGPVDDSFCSTGKCWKGISDVVALDPFDQNTLYVGVETVCAPQVTKSTDQGKTWKKLFPTSGSCGETRVITVDSFDSLILFVGADNLLYRSVDGGIRWKSIRYSRSVGSIASVVLDPKDSQAVYLVGDKFYGILKSTNGGTKWDSNSIVTNYGDRITGLPQGGYRFLTFDPENPNIVYTAGDAGLFISTDRGQNWSAFDSNGLGSAALLDLLVRPAGVLSAGTDQGVFSFSRTSSPGGPVIAQISPSSGRIGDRVKITGSNFGSSQANGQVLFAGAVVSAVESWSDSEIEVNVPSGTVTGGASVSTETGKSNSYEFIVLSASGNKIEPASGPSSGGTKVSILSPENLSGGQFNVLFGSNLAKDIGFTGPNIITCTSPPGNGTVEIQIVFPAITASVGTFTYQ